MVYHEVGEMKFLMFVIFLFLVKTGEHRVLC